MMSCKEKSLRFEIMRNGFNLNYVRFIDVRS